NVNVPAEFLGQPNVTVALRYKATTKAATWEVKNFKMVRGAGDYTPGGDEPADEVRTLPYTESFASSFGGFKNYTTSGAGEWIIDYSTAKATGYDNATKLTTAGTYYLVSPAISLEGVTEANVSYEYILRYDRGAENQQTYISADFADDPTKATWVLLKGDHTEGSDWSTFSKASIDIPAEFLGKQVRIAFRYNTNATSGSTWEVKNFGIQSGKAGSEPEPGGSEDSGDASALNGDFENWDGGKPIHWKSASTASNATLSQSTNAHSGSYSVHVKGQTKNTRLAYKELTLPAGTYTMKFYIKAANAGEVVSCRPGYAIVVDGSISGGDAYKYADYVNDISADEWVLVEHSFTLEAETVVCPLVMNPKNPGKDFLIDDFILSDAAGTFYIK
ncbi:MAG: choice-of-anchor J domain-containing protein, partial [Bacteroidaceae bacterium]|nr:choice-of-anchor J domain-containing protein [Bacteroidaceae bacterium]